MFKNNNNNLFAFSLYGNENEVDTNDIHVKEKINNYNTTSHIISAKEFNREFLINRNCSGDNKNLTYINGNGKLINDYNENGSNANNNNDKIINNLNSNKIIMNNYDKNINLNFHMKNKSNDKIIYENMSNIENSDKAYITNNVKKFLGSFDFLNFKSKNGLPKNGKNNNTDNNNHYIGSENINPNQYNNNNNNNAYKNNDISIHYGVNNSNNNNNKYKAEKMLNHSEYEIINSISNNSSHASNVGMPNEASYNNFLLRNSNKNINSDKNIGIINNNMKLHNNMDIKDRLNNMKREKIVYDKEKKNIDGEYLAHACNYEKIKNNMYTLPKMDKNSEQVINNNQNFYGMEKNISSCVNGYGDKNKSEYPTYVPYYNYDKKKRGVEADKGQGYNIPCFYDINQDKIENRINQKNSFIIEEFEKKNQSLQNSSNGSGNFIYANALKGYNNENTYHKNSPEQNNCMHIKNMTPHNGNNNNHNLNNKNNYGANKLNAYMKIDQTDDIYGIGREYEMHNDIYESRGIPSSHFNKEKEDEQHIKRLIKASSKKMVNGNTDNCNKMMEYDDIFFNKKDIFPSNNINSQIGKENDMSHYNNNNNNIGYDNNYAKKNSNNMNNACYGNYIKEEYLIHFIKEKRKKLEEAKRKGYNNDDGQDELLIQENYINMQNGHNKNNMATSNNNYNMKNSDDDSNSSSTNSEKYRNANQNSNNNNNEIKKYIFQNNNGKRGSVDAHSIIRNHQNGNGLTGEGGPALLNGGALTNNSTKNNSKYIIHSSSDNSITCYKENCLNNENVVYDEKNKIFKTKENCNIKIYRRCLEKERMLNIPIIHLGENDIIVKHIKLYYPLKNVNIFTKISKIIFMTNANICSLYLSDKLLIDYHNIKIQSYLSKGGFGVVYKGILLKKVNKYEEMLDQSSKYTNDTHTGLDDDHNVEKENNNMIEKDEMADQNIQIKRKKMLINKQQENNDNCNNENGKDQKNGNKNLNICYNNNEREKDIENPNYEQNHFRRLYAEVMKINNKNCNNCGNYTNCSSNNNTNHSKCGFIKDKNNFQNDCQNFNLNCNADFDKVQEYVEQMDYLRNKMIEKIFETFNNQDNPLPCNNNNNEVDYNKKEYNVRMSLKEEDKSVIENILKKKKIINEEYNGNDKNCVNYSEQVNKDHNEMFANQIHEDNRYSISSNGEAKYKLLNNFSLFGSNVEKKKTNYDIEDDIKNSNIFNYPNNDKLQNIINGGDNNMYQNNEHVKKNEQYEREYISKGNGSPNQCAHSLEIKELKKTMLNFIYGNKKCDDIVIGKNCFINEAEKIINKLQSINKDLNRKYHDDIISYLLVEIYHNNIVYNNSLNFLYIKSKNIITYSLNKDYLYIFDSQNIFHYYSDKSIFKIVFIDDYKALNKYKHFTVFNVLNSDKVLKNSSVLKHEINKHKNGLNKLSIIPFSKLNMNHLVNALIFGFLKFIFNLRKKYHTIKKDCYCSLCKNAKNSNFINNIVSFTDRGSNPNEYDQNFDDDLESILLQNKINVLDEFICINTNNNDENIFSYPKNKNTTFDRNNHAPDESINEDNNNNANLIDKEKKKDSRVNDNSSIHHMVNTGDSGTKNNITNANANINTNANLNKQNVAQNYEPQLNPNKGKMINSSNQGLGDSTLLNSNNTDECKTTMILNLSKNKNNERNKEDEEEDDDGNTKNKIKNQEKKTYIQKDKLKMNCNNENKKNREGNDFEGPDNEEREVNEEEDNGNKEDEVYMQIPVAIKIHDLKDNKNLKNFLREIEIYKNLQRSNICKFYGICIKHNKLMLLLEYYAKGNLFNFLKNKNKIHKKQRLEWAMQMCSIVHELHSHNPPIINGDIKTSNILINNNMDLVMCDFGKARFKNSKLYSNFGSYRYMAPETFSCTSEVTEKIDIWSLACCIVEIFCSKYPYYNFSKNTKIRHELIVNKRTPHIPSFLPNSIKKCLQKCFSFNPEERPCAYEMYKALKKIKVVE
ncbi:tyrosine kinase-like protein, putative [Plasmodium vinckei vinckei]|uniref:Tyrosine kinase-like protein, putative n=1 Tax=Plasmodium vinckei vinckei TaxID=54757 RepID=A0A449BVC4_PLAVN|nr:tyrosine kinase-like protein, putative [Plasmodium vinckei vinckei]KEG02651.1 TKL protein kinase [Plasmodium vinckei vinckei]VEV57353.1 tyrosine kinase-like protein, putative [Plasmodium vinckei vinckei]